MDLVFDIKKGFLNEVVSNKLLVLVDNDDRNEANDKVLFALINAIKIPIEKTCIVNFTSSTPFEMPQDFEYILLFGYNPRVHLRNARFTLNKPYQLENGSLLCTYSLTELVSDKSKKMELWKALQLMFPQ